ncbi:MAG TPA: peroxide stress protein YaaA [Myxococcales bacterium]|nr:peroxide stress protein YaaA [Deltaproteobacteria bacterium]MBU54900.1 peroxide stress protein YaaA [Deltaproteobacteria bacterium]HAA53959.1 peroxide stress protein YaaA [Myxococcales bacterium]|tara:strand:- start:10674 stop:11447 length:774 start_codon:yes stop_codon:yes gene_type:complete
MLIVLSPAKTLDWTTPRKTKTHTTPRKLDQSSELIEILREYDTEALRSLMKVSEKIALLNIDRYQEFETPFNEENARQALLAFDGDSYTGFELEEYDEDDFSYAQEHLRILSGLYGLLRPLDLIQPYRLEMGTKLKNTKGKDLYSFWGDELQEMLMKDINAQGDDILVNLASNEYFKSLVPKTLPCRVIQPVFKEYKKGTYKMIALYAKRARGMMANYIIRNRIEDPEDLKNFEETGYAFDEANSTDEQFVFLRKSS